jgi:hypothetical protein
MAPDRALRTSRGARDVELLDVGAWLSAHSASVGKRLGGVGLKVTAHHGRAGARGRGA